MKKVFVIKKNISKDIIQYERASKAFIILLTYCILMIENAFPEENTQLKGTIAQNSW